MYDFRPFHNTDPPHLAEIWRQQPRQRGQIEYVSVALLEQQIFSRPIFDPDGFIVATKAERPVGFVHAGFGPSDDECRLSTDLGVVCMLMVRPDLQESSLSEQLLDQSEAYLRARGARVLYAGGIWPLNPFYQGLYGGSELPGVLASDAMRKSLYQQHGYQVIDHVRVMQRRLTDFRPRIDRCQIQLRRCMQMNVCYDPPTGSWWEACTMGNFDRTRFELVPRQGGPAVASATFWDVEPLASSWGVRTAGMLDLQVDPSERRRGHATFLLGEAFAQLHREGVQMVEVQAMAANEAALALYGTLGFVEVDEGMVMRNSNGR
ncbi:MAG: GNAT family N-acetyltransferase [Pirellulales bacterium]